MSSNSQEKKSQTETSTVRKEQKDRVEHDHTQGREKRGSSTESEKVAKAKRGASGSSPFSLPPCSERPIVTYEGKQYKVYTLCGRISELVRAPPASICPDCKRVSICFKYRLPY